ncbi:MAG: hypothetical protein P4L68_11075 [Methylovirgula sp.]|nr:hypothetical protein [Methylovirgula sp.]
MRRRLEWIAPVFLIALLGQFFAPVAAGFAMARTPLADWPICSQSSSVPQAPADRSHHSGDCCAFCTQAHATFVSSDPLQASAAAMANADMRAPFWACAAPPRERPPYAAKARAPPNFS